MQENLKKVVPVNNKDLLIQNFCLSPPLYDFTPPSPVPYPKMIHYQLDNSRHYGHKFTPSFIYNSKPLLIGADIGMDLDQLILFAKQNNQPDKILDQQDQMLLNQTIMNKTYKEQHNKQPKKQGGIKYQN